MKKKIISILIIILLFLTSLLTTSALAMKIKQNKGDISKDNEEFKLNFIYSKNKDYTTNDEHDNNEKTGELDLAIEDFYSWRIPYFPVYEYGDYLCYKYNLSNVGDFYIGEGYAKAYITFIFSDGEEITVLDHTHFFNNYIKKGTLRGVGRFGGDIIPEKIKLEIISDMPESNTDNNVKTVTVTKGVTLSANVYEKKPNGEEKPCEHAVFNCDSDIEGYYNIDYFYLFGSYWIFTPKNPDMPAFEYTLKIKTFFKEIIQKTPPVEEMEYYQTDDIILSRTGNTQINNLLRFSFLQKLINLLN